MTTLPTAILLRRGDGETERNWSDLPDEPLHTILMCLCSLVDLISFKSVCRSWRAVASSLPTSVITSLFPPLLLFTKFSEDIDFFSFRVLDPTSPSFFSLLSCNSDKLKLLDLICYSHGHLLGFLHDRIAVINLFTGGEFYSPILPEIDGLSNKMHHIQFHLRRYVLTGPLSSPHSGLLVFTSGPLLYWHIGSDSWSCHWPKTDSSYRSLRIVSVQGKMYAMNSQDYSLYVLDFNPEFHLKPLAVEGIEKDSFFLDHFLVDCGGELLHIRLYENEDELDENEDDFKEYEEDFPSRFEVFLLDLSANGPRWVKKETLGNWAIFVGCNSCVPGIAVENPERWGGRSNCVYFARKNANGDSPWAAIKLGDMIDTWDPEPELPLYIRKFGNKLSHEWLHPGF